MLFRKGLTNLMAVLTNGIAIYDGEGNADTNIVSLFSSNQARIGRLNSSNVSISEGGISFSDSYGHNVGLIATGNVVDSNVVTQGIPNTIIEEGDSKTFTFIGTPDLVNGNIYVAISTVTSYNTATTTTYGTVLDTNLYTADVASNAEGWELTITAKAPIEIQTRHYFYTSSVSWTISANAPTYQFGGTSTGAYALAANKGTLASSQYQTVLGKYNTEDTNDSYALIVGNGSSDTSRSNALAVDWNGNLTCGTVNGVNVTSIAPSVSSTTATRGSAASTISVNAVRKYGKVVQITLGGIKLASALSSGSTSGTIATVPSGYRPTTNVYGAIGSTGAHAGSYARITTAGVVTIRNSSSSSIATSAELCLTITYIID